MAKLECQVWSQLFLQRDTQRKFAKLEMHEFYGRGLARDSTFITIVRGHPIHLEAADISHILGIPNISWDDYVQHEWQPLDNLASVLKISQKISGCPTLSQYRSVLRYEMSSLHRLYFAVVHKVFILK
ncbi:MAG: hypothetical protein Q8850_02850, partial [Candidatus Phytoplasma australasiaticum]|nr:hypothetical protein [Candidatus Phytoplasma australasiaticum]